MYIKELTGFQKRVAQFLITSRYENADFLPRRLQAQIPGLGYPSETYHFLNTPLHENTDFLPWRLLAQIPGFGHPLRNRPFPYYFSL